MSDFLLRFREPLSAANSLILALLLLWFNPLAPAHKRLPTNLPPIELTLIEPLVAQQIKPKTLMPVAQPSLHSASAMPRSIAPAVVPAMAPIEAANTPAAPGALPAQTAQPISHALPMAASVAAAPPPINSGREAEARYVSKMRAYLQSIKRYPTGREASLQRPSGTVAIWFTVGRNGELADAGIDLSSGAMLLDSTALATVRRGSYPPFPDEAWAGRAQQRFTVELDFVAANN